MKQIMIITKKDLKPIIDKLRELDKKIEQLGEKIKTPACMYCGSIEVTRRGWRYNKKKKVQKYQCKNCGKKFSFNDAFPRMRTEADEIVKALELRKEGKSFGKIANELGNKVTRQSIHRWVQKYQPEQVFPHLHNDKPEKELKIKI